MVPFYTRFRELAFEEMRTITIVQGGDVPAGEYGFLEFYCDEPGCDCRRVHINVVSPPPSTRTWASINYGWEDEAYYSRWGSPDPARSAKGPFLDPLNPQSKYAPAFLDLFVRFCLSDEEYVRRLIRHYGMFKGALLEQNRLGKGPLKPMAFTRTGRSGRRRGGQ